MVIIQFYVKVKVISVILQALTYELWQITSQWATITDILTYSDILIA